jgi:hypothetical protein
MTTKEQKQLTKEFERYLLGLKTKFTPKTIAKVLSGETSIESLNPKLAKSVGILKPIIPMLETPAEIPAETPQQPKAPNIKLTYQKAAKTRQQSISDLAAKNIVQGQSVGSAIKSAFKEKTKARITGIKEAINPLNIAKKVTGGSSLGPALLGRMIGSSQEEIEYFSDMKKTKKGKKNRDPLFVNMLVTGVQNVRGRDGLADVFGKLYELIKSHTEEEKIHDELMHTNKKLAEDDEKKRHEEIIDILTNKTKKEKDEVKKIKEETEGKEKPTSKKTEKVSSKGKTAKKTTTPKGTKPKGATRNVKPGKTSTPAVPPAAGVTAGRALATVAVGAAVATATTGVGAAESGGNYDITFGEKRDKNNKVTSQKYITPEEWSKANLGTEKKLTEMTLEEVSRFQQARIKSGGGSAVGAYQFVKATLDDHVKKLGLDIKTTKFDKNTQEKLYQSFRGETLAILKKNNVPITPGYEYMAHYVGPGGATAVYKAVQSGKDITVAKAIIDAGYKAPGKDNPELYEIRVKDFESILAKRVNRKGGVVHASGSSDQVSSTPAPKANEMGSKVDSGSVSVSDAKKQNNQAPDTIILNKQLTVINKPGTVTNNITKKDGVTGPALIQEQTGF